jgi:hypothetical protein
MTPTVAIIERRHEFAVALQEVVALAQCTAVTLDDFDELAQLSSPPAAVVLRMATNRYFGRPHMILKTLMAAGRPKVFALAWSDEDVAEAERLGCDIVLREPRQIRALYDALVRFVAPDAAGSTG